MIHSLEHALLFWSITALTAVMLLGTLYNFFTAPNLENAHPPVTFPRVSLLIPARNEEENMRTLLPLLAEINYPNLEILILDDASEDATAALAVAPGSAATLLSGKPLPQGWLGKNWACAQLAEHSTGDILIFCDADVSMSPESVTATVGMMQSDALDALTCLPRQTMGTWAEKAVLPVLLFLPVMGFVPIAFISKLSMPILSLGCGQWFAFTRSAYDHLGRHAAVKDVIVEDMALGRLVKQKGLVLGVAISPKYVSTRMYRNFQTVWAGFSKNLAYLTGTGWLRPPLVLTAFLALHALPLIMVLAGYHAWILPLAFWLTSRLLTAVAFRESWTGWIWSPIGVLLIPMMGIRSWWGYRRRSVTWKGRTLNAAFTASTQEVKI